MNSSFMERFLYICLSVLALPFITYLWVNRGSFIDFLVKGKSRIRGRSYTKKENKGSAWSRFRPRSPGAKKFAELFYEHFDSKTGRFDQPPELREVVFNSLFKKVKDGRTYKNLWRTFNFAFHPDRVAQSRFTVEEANTLTKYFQNNFPHPEEMNEI